MSFKIIVCVKLVPDIEHIKKFTEELMSDKTDYILNKTDAKALELALKIKDEYGDVHITAITADCLNAKSMLLECLALGADDAIHICDDKLNDLDTLAMSKVLSSAIDKTGAYDIVITGCQAPGGETGHVGPQVAENLKLPQITNAVDIKLSSNMEEITAVKPCEDKNMIVKVKTPCMITVSSDANKPRNMTIQGIIDAENKHISLWNLEESGINEGKSGSDMSAAKQVKTFLPTHRKKGIKIITETDIEAAKLLHKEIKKIHI